MKLFLTVDSRDRGIQRKDRDKRKYFKRVGIC